jgi:hypothetical protein
VKKTIITVVAVLFLGTSLARADSPSVTLYSKVWSKYHGGNGGIYHLGPVHQSGLTIAFDNCVYADIWGSYSLDGKQGFGKELDYTLGCATNVGDFGLDLGISYFQIWPIGFGDIVQPYLKVDRAFNVAEAHTIAPYFKLEVYIPTRKVPSGGVITAVGLGHNWQATDFLSLNHTAAVKFDNGAFGNEAAVIGHYEVGLHWKLRKNLILQFPLLKATTPLTGVRDGRKTEFTVGTGMTLNFNLSDLVK